jgi:hypothetical protein
LRKCGHEEFNFQAAIRVLPFQHKPHFFGVLMSQINRFNSNIILVICINIPMRNGCYHVN